MKIEKQAFIDDEYRQLAANKLVLELGAGGRGALTVEGEVTKGQRVAIDMGINGKAKRWFTGFVTKTNPMESGYTRIIVRETCFLLNSPRAISLQHATLKDVLATLTDLTGVRFIVPEGAEYTQRKIPNFTSHGSGYQALENAGRAFSVPDFTWFQQPDGFIWVGSYQDSRWFGKPVTIPEVVSNLQAGANLLQTVFMPVIRPGTIVNGNRITQVDVADDEMTLTWNPHQKQQSPLQREMQKELPELAAGFHLPKFGVVVAVADKAKAGQLNDPYRPRFSVDVQLLDENCNEDRTVPVYKALSLPVIFGGAEQGMMATPTEGTVVELAFAYGRADRAFVRTILGTDWPLPDIAPDEQLQQQRAEVYNRTSAAGNQTRATDQVQTDEAFIKHDQADCYRADYGDSQIKVESHSREEVGGTKAIEALGSLELFAGDNLELGCLGNLHAATAGDLVQVVGKMRDIVIALSDKVTVLGDRISTIEGNDTLNIAKDLIIKAKNITEDADTIKLNGGKGVCTGGTYCPFTGKPHVDVSTTVFAGK